MPGRVGGAHPRKEGSGCGIIPSMSTTTGIAVAATFVWLGMVLAVGAEVVEVAALAAGGALLLAG